MREIFFVGETRLAEMHLIIDDARNQSPPVQINQYIVSNRIGDSQLTDFSALDKKIFGYNSIRRRNMSIDKKCFHGLTAG